MAAIGEPGYDGDDAVDSLTLWIWWWNRLMRENDERDDTLYTRMKPSPSRIH
jgi:hypothetical protein